MVKGSFPIISPIGLFEISKISPRGTALLHESFGSVWVL